ncbi:MAG: hypothetical protein KAJ72_07760 [Candidatus Heimdallarchaeota archaeon]|nr:hypothetical protein [Candidatus Heimdallarchaeota archaeon]MCK5409712.1 hypothetical protein [Candidatus Heimdallarchaeota archaeon]
MVKQKEKTKFELMTQANYEKLAKIELVPLSDGSQIRTLTTEAPEETSNNFTIVLVAGWVSIVLGWDDLLMEAKEFFNILYIETREKATSIVPKKGKFDLDRYALDIKEALEYHQLNEKETIILSTSFAAILVALMLKNLGVNPNLSIFVGPIERISLPVAIKLALIILPSWMANLIKPVGYWWVRKFKTEDEYQAARYIRAIRDSDPRKWKNTIRHVAFAKFWDFYEGLENNILVIDESEDPLHDTEITKKIASLMPNSKLIDIKTNRAAHSSPMIEIMREKIRENL